MNMNCTMTASEINAMLDVFVQMMPELEAKAKEVLPAPGKSKLTTIKNQKLLFETFENSDVVSVSFEIDPEFLTAVFEMLGGFTGNISSACKALKKHGKLLMSLMGAEEVINKINGMVVGKECDSEGNPMEPAENNEADACNDETEIDKEEPSQSSERSDKEEENKVYESPTKIKFETPIADVAQEMGFNV